MGHDDRRAHLYALVVVVRSTAQVAFVVTLQVDRELAVVRPWTTIVVMERADAMASEGAKQKVRGRCVDDINIRFLEKGRRIGFMGQKNLPAVTCIPPTKSL